MAVEMSEEASRERSPLAPEGPSGNAVYNLEHPRGQAESVETMAVEPTVLERSSVDNSWPRSVNNSVDARSPHKLTCGRGEDAGRHTKAVEDALTFGEGDEAFTTTVNEVRETRNNNCKVMVSPNRWA